ncbi:MAG: PAS domain-containing protein [Clostridium sp.]|nr:PAS domain-containing protein [Clostridium sp.]
MERSSALLRTFFALFLPFLLIFASFCLGIYYLFAGAIRERIISANLTLLSSVSGELDRTIDELITYTQNTFSEPALLSAVAAGDAVLLRERLRPFVQNRQIINRVSVTTPEAILVADYPEEPLLAGADFSQRDWYRGVSRDWQPYLSEIFLRAAEPKRYVVSLAVPIKEGNNVLGVVVIQLVLADLFAPLHFPLGNGYIYAVDKHGNLVFHPHLDIDGIISYRMDPAVQHFLLDRAGSGSDIFFDPINNEERLSSWMGSGGGQLGLIAQEPTRTAFAPVDRMLYILLIAGALILAFIILIIYRQSVMIEKERALNERLKRKTTLEEGFREVLLFLNQPFSNQEMFATKLLALLTDISGAWGGILYLYADGTLRSFAKKAVKGEPPAFQLNEGIPGMALAEKRTVRSQQQECTARQKLVSGFGEFSPWEIVAIPLFKDGMELGVMELAYQQALPEDMLRSLEHALDKVADVLAAQKTRALLEEQRSLRQIMMDTVLDLIFYKDAAGTYLMVNKAFADFLNKSQDEIIGLTDTALFPAWEANRDREDDQTVIKERKMIVVNDQIVTGANERQLLAMTVKTPVFNDQGQVAGLVGVARDVSKLKEAEQQLLQQNEELQQQSEELQLQKEELHAQQSELHFLLSHLEEANQAKGRFLARISHELRTPLSSIIGFSEVLLDSLTDPLTAKQKEYVGNIAAGGHHLLALSNSILDLAKIEAGKIELEPELLEPDALVRQALSIVSETADKKRIAINLHISESLPHCVLADPLKFKQILINLLTNALKFTPSGGKVDVTLEKRNDSGGKIPVQGEYLQVAIADTGIGISLADRENLFKEFTQLASAQGRQQQGAGLGLALSKYMVELHGGNIWLDSKEGEGTTFYFTIPVGQSSIWELENQEAN